jgi:hypothetical protein
MTLVGYSVNVSVFVMGTLCVFCEAKLHFRILVILISTPKVGSVMTLSTHVAVIVATSCTHLIHPW